MGANKGGIVHSVSDRFAAYDRLTTNRISPILVDEKDKPAKK